MTTPGEELRSASEKLRQRADMAERGLGPALHDGTRDLFGNAKPNPAAMNPFTVRAVADLLESASYDPDDSALDDPGSDRHDACDRTVCVPAAALHIARAINGATS